MFETAEKLRTFGIRPSVHRMAIYRYLDEKRNHPTAEMIFQALSPENPTLSRTTVYNTLKLFASSAAVSEVIIEDGEMRYDADIAPHAHFKCSKCGAIHDFFFVPHEHLPRLAPQFKIQEIHVNSRGLCPECTENAMQD